ncbi:hypothetical protein F4809DRAFT_199373 [Biscogniauxia mediterranea]|nr:hypothetical protein F4809DRAFT_199373 [Biscogniauxia mediterranea]
MRIGASWAMPARCLLLAWTRCRAKKTFLHLTMRLGKAVGIVSRQGLNIHSSCGKRLAALCEPPHKAGLGTCNTVTDMVMLCVFLPNYQDRPKPGNDV